MTETKEVFEYTLFLQGLFRRNRKLRRTNVHMFDNSPGKAPCDTIRDAASAKLVELEAKKGCQWYVLETPVKIEERNHDGVVMVSRLSDCFSGLNVLKGTVE